MSGPNVHDDHHYPKNEATEAQTGESHSTLVASEVGSISLCPYLSHTMVHSETVQEASGFILVLSVVILLGPGPSECQFVVG